LHCYNLWLNAAVIPELYGLEGVGGNVCECLSFCKEVFEFEAYLVVIKFNQSVDGFIILYNFQWHFSDLYAASCIFCYWKY